MKPIMVHVPRGDWYAVWHGGEYIDIFADPDSAQAAADGGYPEHDAVHTINTTGHSIGDDPEALLHEAQEWADEFGSDYRRNGWGA